MFKLAAKILAVTSVSLLLGCGKIYNSSSYDSSTYGGGGSGGGGGGTSNFQLAKAVINQHCSTCHTRASHLAWTNMTEQEYITQGLVTAGSLENSSLYTKIYGNRTAISGNMPQSAPALSSDELTKLETWILGITP